MTMQRTDQTEAVIAEQYDRAKKQLEATLYRIVYGISAQWPPKAADAAAIRAMTALDHELRALAYGLPEPPGAEAS